MKKLIAVGLMFAAVTVGVWFGTGAGGNMAAASDDIGRFHGSQESISIVDPASCDFVALECDVSFGGTVKASHVGNGTLAGGLRVNIIAFVLPPGSGVCSNLVPGTGWVTYTARNGDVLYMTMSKNETCVNADLSIDFNGVYDVDGEQSTGRVAGASGSINVTSEVFEQLPNGTSFHVDGLEGWISLADDDGVEGNDEDGDDDDDDDND